MAFLINKIKKRVKRTLAKYVEPEHANTQQQNINVVEQYVTEKPNPQNALDIFQGEWSSKLPESEPQLKAGTVALFNDSRLEWAVEQLGGVQGQNILELGPLEGGHSYMLEKFGAQKVIAIEANTRAYLRCLISKEIFALKQVEFLCGDFIEYLRDNETKFDVCIASGVLYHMRNPVELIELISKASDKVYFWTHYYDSSSPLAHRFSEGETQEYAGFKHKLYRQEYGAAVFWGGFCGGSKMYSNWMSRDDILGCLKHFGFKNVAIDFEAPNHQNGPSFAFTATR